MNLEKLKEEAAALDDAGQKELFAFLVSLREEKWAAHARAVSNRLDDPDPGRWITLEELKARLDKIPEPAGE